MQLVRMRWCHGRADPLNVLQLYSNKRIYAYLQPLYILNGDLNYFTFTF